MLRNNFRKVKTELNNKLEEQELYKKGLVFVGKLIADYEERVNVLNSQIKALQEELDD